MKKTLAPIAAVLLISSFAQAGSFADKCPDITACAKVVGEMLDQKYIFDADVKGKVEATSNLELTPENAELLFTNILNMNGFTRVPLSAPKTYQIMRQRDARDSAIPVVTADQKKAPALPNNWDVMTLRYKATHADSVEAMARFSRSLMPAAARIIPVEMSGTLLITDTAVNLKKMYELLKDADQKPTPEMKRRWAEREKALRKESSSAKPNS